MAKVVIDPVTSGYNLSKINANLQLLADELNNNVLYRDNPVGEPNSLVNDIDMNSNDILNAATVYAQEVTVDGIPLAEQVADAAASAAAALVSETNAAASETAAASSESNAAASEVNTAAIYDEFDDRYLGAKGAPPVLDNDGNALQIGAQYFYTVDDTLYVYTSTGWATGISTVVAAEAAASAAAALVSETNAAASEANAATSESNAATSETNAATSEANALTSETNAAASEAAAAASAAGVNLPSVNPGDARKILQVNGAEDGYEHTTTVLRTDTATTQSIGSDIVVGALQAAGDEGGQVEFTKAPNGTCIGNPFLDVYLDTFRLIANPGGTTKVLDFDMSVGGTNYHSGNFGKTQIDALGVNADTVDGVHLQGIMEANSSGGADLNTIVKAGCYRVGNTEANLPVGAQYGQLLVIRGEGDTIAQIASSYDSTELYYRSGNSPDVGGSGSWGAWKQIWHEGSIAIPLRDSSAYDVGSIVYAANTSGGTVNHRASTAGSNVKPVSLWHNAPLAYGNQIYTDGARYTTNVALSGTWRNVGGDCLNWYVSMWVRIA